MSSAGGIPLKNLPDQRSSEIGGPSTQYLVGKPSLDMAASPTSASGIQVVPSSDLIAVEPVPDSNIRLTPCKVVSRLGSLAMTNPSNISSKPKKKHITKAMILKYPLFYLVAFCAIGVVGITMIGVWLTKGTHNIENGFTNITYLEECASTLVINILPWLKHIDY